MGVTIFVRDLKETYAGRNFYLCRNCQTHIAGGDVFFPTKRDKNGAVVAAIFPHVINVYEDEQLWRVGLHDVQTIHCTKCCGILGQKYDFVRSEHYVRMGGVGDANPVYSGAIELTLNRLQLIPATQAKAHISFQLREDYVEEVAGPIGGGGIKVIGTFTPVTQVEVVAAKRKSNNMFGAESVAVERKSNVFGFHPNPVIVTQAEAVPAKRKSNMFGAEAVPAERKSNMFGPEVVPAKWKSNVFGFHPNPVIVTQAEAVPAKRKSNMFGAEVVPAERKSNMFGPVVVPAKWKSNMFGFHPNPVIVTQAEAVPAERKSNMFGPEVVPAKWKSNMFGFHPNPVIVTQAEAVPAERKSNMFELHPNPVIVTQAEVVPAERKSNMFGAEAVPANWKSNMFGFHPNPVTVIQAEVVPAKRRKIKEEDGEVED